MKIIAIETHVCNARMRNWIFVKVLTDQPGLWGWGEFKPPEAGKDLICRKIIRSCPIWNW